jgi:hypothetical protein
LVIELGGRVLEQLLHFSLSAQFAQRNISRLKKTGGSRFHVLIEVTRNVREHSTYLLCFFAWGSVMKQAKRLALKEPVTGTNKKPVTSTTEKVARLKRRKTPK